MSKTKTQLNNGENKMTDDDKHKMTNTEKHTHHIIPKHMGGLDYGWNLAELSLEDCYDANRRWKDWCDEYGVDSRDHQTQLNNGENKMTTLYHTTEGKKRPPETANELEHATAMAMAKDHWDSIEANRKKDYPSMTEKEAHQLISGMISLCELKSPNYYFETDYDLHKYSDLVDVFLGIEFIMDMIESQEMIKEVKESYENDLVELSKESNKIIASRVKLELTDSEVKAIKVWEQIAKKEVTKAFNKYQN